MSGKLWRRGTHRTLPPEVTVERLRGRLGTFGITRIADITGLDRIGLPVVTVVRPLSRSLAVAQGKGLTTTLAIASGLMEAIEIWHAERLPALHMAATYAALSATAAVADLARLPWQAGAVPDDARPLRWVPGEDLLDHASPCWVPYALVHADYRAPPGPDAGLFCASTNGLASGNCRDEALLHGLCEVIERDALTLWHRLDEDARAATRIDPDGIDDPDCRSVLGLLDAADLAVGLWDATSDVKIAAVHAEIAERGQARPVAFAPVIAGDGCHPSRTIATLRALTEAAQSRLTYIAGAREDIDPDVLAAMPEQTEQARARLVAPLQSARSFATVPDQDGADLATDLAVVLAGLRHAGIDQAIAVDLAREATDGVAVVRVVVPGLETVISHPHYRPGARARAAGGPLFRVVPFDEAML